jgi:Bacterial protein of unknown function (Gcw_chp).
MKKIIFTLMIVLTISTIKAQDVDFSLGADLFSSYVWRGAYQTSAAVQPAMGLSVSGFSLSAWGSIPVMGDAKEVDFTVAYEIAGLSLAVTDYWWAGEGAYKYFMYESKRTAHLFEGTLGYTLPIEKFPLGISWNTMFAGGDYLADGDRAYSTYITASYPFKIKAVDLGLSMGLTPWKSIYADDFSVIHIGLKASKELKVTDHFSIHVSGEIITNPRSEDIFFVFGISL